MLASGASTLATAGCRWKSVHNPACTQATSATTTATVRIEGQPRGAKCRDPNLPPRSNQGRHQRTLAPGIRASRDQSWPMQGKQTTALKKLLLRNYKTVILNVCTASADAS